MSRAAIDLKDFPSNSFPDAEAPTRIDFDANGELIASWTGEEGALKAVASFEHGFSNSEDMDQVAYRWPIVQRFADGRWLIVESRVSGKGKNATILSSSFAKLAEFHVGDAVEHVYVDQKDRIWIGYFDESGGEGLIRYSAQGGMIYSFNQSSGMNILDLYAMTADSRGEIFICPYTDFYLAHISDGDVTVVMDKAPVRGAHAICVGGGFAAFFGSYDGNDVLVCDLNSGESRSISLHINGQEIQRRSPMATRGETIAVLRQNEIHRFQLIDLIKACLLYTSPSPRDRG